MSWGLFLFLCFLPVISLILLSTQSGGYGAQPGARKLPLLFPIQCDKERTPDLEYQLADLEARLNKTKTDAGEESVSYGRALVAAIGDLHGMRTETTSAVVELNIARVCMTFLRIAYKRYPTAKEVLGQWEKSFENAMERADVLLTQSRARYLPETRGYWNDLKIEYAQKKY